MGKSAQLIDGADLGAVLQGLWKKILEIIKEARRSETTLRALRSTLKDLSPLVDEIQNFNANLGLPNQEIQSLISVREAGDEVSNKSSKTRLRETQSEEMVRDVKETLKQVREILEKIKEENTNSGQRIKCMAPANPEFMVGMEQLMARLKMEVLKDGVSTLGLTGLPGSGKTTLASALCWDPQVKGKFGDHILFVTFSKAPNLKAIVEALVQHCGYEVSGFHSDEDAVKEFGDLVKIIGESPILLVLDDVWPGSESLIENFKFQIRDYKILVTSRVAFQAVDLQIHLEPLPHEDALTLFLHVALPKDKTSCIPDEYLIQEVVKGCRGSPLAIKVIGRSLRHQPLDVWQKMVKQWSQGYSILDSNTNLLYFLQKSLDVLEDESIIKECFMDLGLFPEDQRIPVTALIDMWAELHNLDDDGVQAMNIITVLASRNLASVLITRKVENDSDNYYNNHFIMMHDLLRELAIYQSNQEPFEQRKRLVIDINEINRQWYLKEKQQGIIACMSSLFLKWCAIQKQRHVIARTLSISTDETSTDDWCDKPPTETEVLILSVRTKEYSLPEFIPKMRKLKVLTFTNYGSHISELKNFKQLGSLSNLKRIRLEKVSVPYLVSLKNLLKLSLYMCNISEAFEKNTIPISEALPNLVDLNIDYCKDLVELPAGFCYIKPLKKLSISNCHKFYGLPQEIGKLENLEVMRLNSCTDLEDIPESIGNLSKLSFLDISNCISLRNLPEDIGNLKTLEKVYMTGCSRCELPASVINLEHLKGVTCDEETAASWEVFKPMLPNLSIEVPHVDVNLDWLLGTRSSS